MTYIHKKFRNLGYDYPEEPRDDNGIRIPVKYTSCIIIPQYAYILFKNNQAKYTDPILYDDKGNIIPLSKRFNPLNPDMRY